MNKAKIESLKHITAECLTGLQIYSAGMEDFLSIKTKIHTEIGCFSRLISIAKSCGTGSVFLLSQEGVEDFDRAILPFLEGEEVVVKRLGKSVAVSKPFIDSLAKLVPKNAKLIIATGGGVLCDIAKLIAKLADLPLCFIPSAPTSDGMLSDFSVQFVDGGVLIIPAKSPEFLVCDASHCKDVPARLFRAGFGDVVSNYLAVFDWMVAKDFFDRKFSEEVAYLAISSADKAVIAGEIYQTDKEKGVQLLFDALILSSGAMALMGENTPCCGGEHALSVALAGVGGGKDYMHGEGVFLSFCKLVDIYQLFFKSYSTGKYLPPDTSARCDFIISQFGVSEQVAENMCKPPISEDEYKIMREKYRICKGRYLPTIKKLQKKLPQLKRIFFSIYNEDLEKFNLNEEMLSKAVAISPDIQDKFTTLTLMREFGLLEALL